MDKQNHHVAKVLIFDSGVGGLSVYQEIHQQYPQLDYIYLFDSKAYPYGELAENVVIERVLSLILGMTQQHPIDLVVLACNTASTIALPHLRQALDIPVVGVVPAIKPAADIAQQAIGLIATPATIHRPYTHELITTFSTQVDVKLLGHTRLVEMAESKLRGHLVDLEELQQILMPLIGQIDVAVLGCTHFPLLKEEIQLILGQEVHLIDSGLAIANRVGHILDLTPQAETQSIKAKYPIYSSAMPWEVEALNKELYHWGFLPVVVIPSQDV